MFMIAPCVRASQGKAALMPSQAPFQVDGERLIPERFVGRLDRAARADAGVVDQDVETSPALDDRVNGACPVVGASDVQRQADRFATFADEQFRRAPNGVGVDVGQGDFESGFRQRAGDSEADALRRAETIATTRSVVDSIAFAGRLSCG